MSEAQFRTYVMQQFNAQVHETAMLLGQLQENTTLTRQVKEAQSSHQQATADVLAAFQAAQGGFKVLEWIGRVVAKPITLILAAGAAITAAWFNVKGLWK